MTREPRYVLLGLLLGLTTAGLTACGGGGGGSAPSMSGGGGGTTLPTVQGTHLGLTDHVFTLLEPDRVIARDEEAVGTPTYTSSRRDEVVCAGTTCRFPIGADGGRNELDGTWHNRRTARDASLAAQQAILNRGRTRAGTLAGNVPAFRVDVENALPQQAAVYGGWGMWSVFYAVWERDSRNTLDLTWSGAFGVLTNARPTAEQGSATWTGAMVGRTRTGSVELAGQSRLVYDFDDQSLDLTLSSIALSARARTQGQTYTGPTGFTWTGLPVAENGTFGLAASRNDRTGTNLDPTLGQVEGAFYGPTAGEAAGVFERGGVAGAFGARRQ